MRSSIIVAVVIVLATAFFAQVHGQEKYETERRIRVEEVPTSAVQFVGSLPIKRKIKWYLERSVDRQSVEAKFRLNRKKHSIEFDSEGNLEDAEMNVRFSSLDKQVRDSIKAALRSKCLKFKIRKTQLQYSGDPSAVLSGVKTGKILANTISRYEIIARCKATNGVSLFEYLFSNAGQLLTSSKIIFKNSSNLEY